MITPERRARAAQAIALKKDRKLPQAVQLLEELVAEDREDAYSAGHLAHAHLLAGRAHEALALANELLARDPANGFVSYVRAEAGFKLRQWPQAAADYESAAAGGFRSAWVYGRWAEALRRNGDAEGAHGILARGLADFPGDGKLLLALSKLEKKAGDSVHAEQHMEEAARALPDDPYAYAEMVAARAKKKSRSRAGAAAELKQLLKIPSQRKNPFLHDELAQLLVAARDWPAAVAAARQAHELAPDNRMLHKRLGWTLVKAGEDREACAIFSACLEDDPEDPALNRSYVSASSRLGRLDEAHAFYTTLLRRHPEAKKVFGWLRRVAREAGEIADSGD